MSYPRQLSREKILEMGVEMLKTRPEADLRPLARKLNVKAPSLYRYFRSKEDLQKGLAEEGYRRLGLALRSSGARKPAFAAMAAAYRQFALAHPRLYHLMHRPGYEPEEMTPVVDAAVKPIADQLGLDRYDAAFVSIFRALRAYVHGFISLEMSGNFGARGNVARDFQTGLETLVQALSGR